MPHNIGHPLDETTQLYCDVHIALEVLHMRYPAYIAQTTATERQLYQYFLALRSQKEKHLQWHAEHDSKAEHIARSAIDPSARP